MSTTILVTDLLIVLAAGFVSGMVCRQMGVSMLVGYLLAGAAIGNGALGIVTGESHELEQLAHVGALLLLFSIGVEFSLDALLRLSRYFLLGGTLQLLLVLGPTMAACAMFGVRWETAVLVGAATAFSSTVLVFKALAEWGQTATPLGRRAIAILLFQDAALIPLILLIPYLTGEGPRPAAGDYAILAFKSLFFVTGILAVRGFIAGVLVPLLAALRSAELVVLFTLTVLGGACLGAYVLQLPSALGAFAAGLMLGDNRLSRQVDALILPYRETFAAVFFVTLGTLLRPWLLWEAPWSLSAALATVLLLKTAAAALALRAVGLGWKVAVGMGLGLSQLGEFSFVLLSEGWHHRIVSDAVYGRMMFVALGSLIATPSLLRVGLQLAGVGEGIAEEEDRERRAPAERGERGVVIGAGPIGRQVASLLETLGVDVCVVDLSPINLQPFAQQGLHAVAGDAREDEVLRRAGVDHCRLAVISVPDDRVANQVTAAVRGMNPTVSIVVRCRYQANMGSLRRAGADAVVSEEAQAAGPLLEWCRRITQGSRERPG